MRWLKSQERVLNKLIISYYQFGKALLKIDPLGQFSSSSAASKVFSHLEKLCVIISVISGFAGLVNARRKTNSD